MMTATIAQAEHVGTFAEGSPEWQAARDGAITGSRIAAVCGLSPWESPFSLWHRMAGVAPEQPVSDLMHWGTKLEPLILSEYADRRRIVGHQLVAKPGLFRHHTRTWQMVTPDALNGDRVVEVKYSPMTDGWGDEGTDQIPVYYRAQVLWQLDVFGYRQADVCVFFGGSGEYREYIVDYDPDDITVLRDKARAFLASLDKGERPSIDGHDATYQVVRDLHPDIDDEAIDLPGDVGDRYLAASPGSTRPPPTSKPPCPRCSTRWAAPAARSTTAARSRCASLAGAASPRSSSTRRPSRSVRK